MALGLLAATAAMAGAGLAVLLVAGDAVCGLRVFAPGAVAGGAPMDGMAMPGMAMPAHGSGLCPILLAACAAALVVCVLCVFGLMTGGVTPACDSLEAAVSLVLRRLRSLAARRAFAPGLSPACRRFAFAPVPVAGGVSPARRRPSRAPPMPLR